MLDIPSDRQPDPLVTHRMEDKVFFEHAFVNKTNHLRVNSNTIVRINICCPSWCLKRLLMDILCSVTIFLAIDSSDLDSLKIILETFLKQWCLFFHTLCTEVK